MLVRTSSIVSIQVVVSDGFPHRRGSAFVSARSWKPWSCCATEVAWTLAEIEGSGAESVEQCGIARTGYTPVIRVAAPIRQAERKRPDSEPNAIKCG
jgi:hypothetical protein